MNPADSDSLREQLEAQASAIQRHDEQLTSITGGLQEMADRHERSMGSIQEHFQKLSLSDRGSVPVPSSSPLVQTPPASDVRLPPPEYYSGASSSYRPFFVQCSLAFELQSSTFPTERSRVAYILSLLSGRAKDWGTTEWEKQSPICSSVKLFSTELRKIFDHATPGREAARGLFDLTQREIRVWLLHRVSHHSSWEQLECCLTLGCLLPRTLRPHLRRAGGPRSSCRLGCACHPLHPHWRPSSGTEKGEGPVRPSTSAASPAIPSSGAPFWTSLPRP